LASRYDVIEVAIVEDDERVRTSLARLLARAEGLCCTSQHADAEDALLALPSLEPDVVLMDIKLPRMSGVECVAQLKPVLPNTQFIMLTVYQDNALIFRALAAGATGYLLKRTRGPELAAAIRDVHRGGSPMSNDIARKVVQFFRQDPTPPSPSDTLTPREQEVLTLLSQGFLYREIADRLAIGYDTVHAHVRKIYEKLQVHTRTQAAAVHLARVLSPHSPSAPGGEPTRSASPVLAISTPRERR
jgi:DNA-binding NarL/FixJ family response regulator